jgi:hypothetical protein
MKRFLWIAVVGLVVACDAPITEQEVPGVYHWDQKGVVDTLIVSANRTYVHVYGASVREQGTWELEEIDGYKRVTFAKYRFYGPVPGGSIDAPGFWPALIERGSNGLPRLSLAADEPLYYVRDR